MSVDYITQKLNNTHITPYHDTIKIDSLYTNSLTICVNIKDQYNHAIYDLKSTTHPIIYTEKGQSDSYTMQPSISPQPTMYVCPSPPRATHNRSFCWSHALNDS